VEAVKCTTTFADPRNSAIVVSKLLFADDDLEVGLAYGANAGAWCQGLDSDAEAAAAADADVAAGRVVPHSEVRKWLMPVGTPDEFPIPRSWLK
jgi:hypothetical protein